MYCCGLGHWTHPPLTFIWSIPIAKSWPSCCSGCLVSLGPRVALKSCYMHRRHILDPSRLLEAFSILFPSFSSFPSSFSPFFFSFPLFSPCRDKMSDTRHHPNAFVPCALRKGTPRVFKKFHTIMLIISSNDQAILTKNNLSFN